MSVFKMFLVGAFLAAGVVGTFAPWLSAQMYGWFASAAVAAKIESLVEMSIPVITGLLTAFASARAKRSSGERVPVL